MVIRRRRGLLEVIVGWCLIVYIVKQEMEIINVFKKK